MGWDVRRWTKSGEETQTEKKKKDVLLQRTQMKEKKRCKSKKKEFNVIQDGWEKDLAEVERYGMI